MRTPVECDINLMRMIFYVAYDPLKEEIGSWRELGSSRESSYRAYSDYESTSRVHKRPLSIIIIINNNNNKTTIYKAH